jgi:murein L,D-transpeptidase YcbB/YkuD
MRGEGVRQTVRTGLIAIVLSTLLSVIAFADEPRPSGLMLVRLSTPGAVTVKGQVLDKTQLRAFYAVHQYRLAWNCDCTGLDGKAAAVAAALIAADVQGLEPADYHIRQIAGLAAADTEVDRVDRDLLITDALLRYAADVSVGRLGAQQTDERAAGPEAGGFPATLAVAAAGTADELAQFLTALPPRSAEYEALKGKLAELRRLPETDAWLPLPDGPSIHPGAHDPVVPELRKRLLAEGLLSRAAAGKGADDLYDSKLAAAVSSFQAQHGIKPDGVLGKDSRAALSVSVDDRIHQVVANLERARWGDDVPRVGRAVQVNLAQYSLTVYQDGAPILGMPVVVGSSENPTPIISSRITTVVLNPNWTLPPNVIKEILPRIREDSGYLAGRGIARIEEDGKVRLVQPPGPTNPLGHYKFVMPNDKDIYLHDSPDVVKFRFARRNYSHGCVRLGNAAALASLLLEDRATSLPDSLDGLVHAGTTRHIALSKPVPVSLVYHTAWFDQAGHLVLGIDTYGRDERLWKALHKARTATSRRLAGGLSRGEVL